MSDETCRHGANLKSDCDDCQTVVRLTTEVTSLQRQLLRATERAQRAEDLCDQRTNEREAERTRAERAEARVSFLESTLDKMLGYPQWTHLPLWAARVIAGLARADDGLVANGVEMIPKRKGVATYPGEANVEDIVTWLRGLEHALRSTLRMNIEPDEREQLTHRRGIYDGIADDIESKWRVRKSSKKSSPNVTPMELLEKAVRELARLAHKDGSTTLVSSGAFRDLIAIVPGAAEMIPAISSSGPEADGGSGCTANAAPPSPPAEARESRGATSSCSSCGRVAGSIGEIRHETTCNPQGRWYAEAGPQRTSEATSAHPPWLTVINYEGRVEALPWADEQSARNYFDPMQQQWSESWLCRAVIGPRDMTGMVHPPQQRTATIGNATRIIAAWLSEFSSVCLANDICDDHMRDLAVRILGEHRSDAPRTDSVLRDAITTLNEELGREADVLDKIDDAACGAQSRTLDQVIDRLNAILNASAPPPKAGEATTRSSSG